MNIDKNDFIVDTAGLKSMYKKLYWNQIFSFKTKWRVKIIAIKSLWYMRYFFKGE